MINTIITETLELFDSIFSEDEYDKQDRKNQAKQISKLNKTKIKKTIAKNKLRKRDDDTLEKRAREKALRDMKKEITKNSSVKDISNASIGKKEKTEDKLETDSIQNKIERKVKDNLRALRKKEKTK